MSWKRASPTAPPPTFKYSSCRQYLPRTFFHWYHPHGSWRSSRASWSETWQVARLPISLMFSYRLTCRWTVGLVNNLFAFSCIIYMSDSCFWDGCSFNQSWRPRYIKIPYQGLFSSHMWEKLSSNFLRHYSHVYVRFIFRRSGRAAASQWPM